MDEHVVEALRMLAEGMAGVARMQARWAGVAAHAQGLAADRPPAAFEEAAGHRHMLCAAWREGWQMAALRRPGRLAEILRSVSERPASDAAAGGPATAARSPRCTRPGSLMSRLAALLVDLPIGQWPPRSELADRCGVSRQAVSVAICGLQRSGRLPRRSAADA